MRTLTPAPLRALPSGAGAESHARQWCKRCAVAAEGEGTNCYPVPVKVRVSRQRVCCVVSTHIAEQAIDRHKHRLDRHLDSWQSHLPGWAERSLRWLRKPAVRWVRIPVGVALVAAGLLAVLPVFGLWMIPLGLLLLALDLPFLRPPMRRAIVSIKHRTKGLRRRYRAARKQRGL